MPFWLFRWSASREVVDGQDGFFVHPQGEMTMTQTPTAQPFTLPTYRHSFTQLDTERHALWHYLNPEPRPVFTQTVLSEILDVQARVKLHLSTYGDKQPEIHYLIIASAIPGVYSLGGDLALFADLIRHRQRDHLLDYGRQCIECVFNSFTNVGNPQLTTISLVQGTALGGGFEAALANNVIVAERSASFGLPEILFNLFPGMGAYSLLARRLDMVRAERFLSGGRQYSAAELYELGVVDVLAEDGQGVHAVNNFIRKHGRSRNGLQAIQQVRQRLAPLAFQELEDVVAIWVDTAMRLTERDLRTMERLVAAQQRLAKRTETADIASVAQEEQLVYAGVA
jgi:DSF synthase